MKILINMYCENYIKSFISTTKPVECDKFKLERIEEDAGWVNSYFKYNDISIRVLLTLATSDLSDLVEFFENLINMNEEMVTFLDDEIVSEPLLYASPVDDEKIRFIIADGEKFHTKWKNGELDGEAEPRLYQYEIRCDVIIDKNKLLKEFYYAVKNLINSFVPDEHDIYNIEYKNWKDNFKNIINYAKKNV